LREKPEITKPCNLQLGGKSSNVEDLNPIEEANGLSPPCKKRSFHWSQEKERRTTLARRKPEKVA